MAAASGVIAETSAAAVPEKWSILGPIKRPAMTEAQISLHKSLHASMQEKYAGDEAAKSYLDSAAVLRYLWAHQFDEAKARKNLEETVAWRASYMTPDMYCDLCEKDERNHCFMLVGRDKFQRPIMYVCPARSSTSDGPATMRHVVAEMEAVFKEAGTADNWVWIMDLRNFSLMGSGFSMSLGKEFVNIFTAHYPERLGVMILLEPPTLLSWTISALKAFMDPVTVRKLAVIYKADLPEVVATLASNPAQATWLLEAMKMDANPGNLPKALPEGAQLPQHKVVPARKMGGSASPAASSGALGGAGAT